MEAFVGAAEEDELDEVFGRAGGDEDVDRTTDDDANEPFSFGASSCAKITPRRNLFFVVAATRHIGMRWSLLAILKLESMLASGAGPMHTKRP